MQDSEVSKSHREFSVRSDGAVEHEAMSGAVHWLHAETLILHLKQVHIVLVVLVMAGGLPEFEVEHVGTDDLLVTSYSVFFSHKFEEAVVNFSTIGIPETTSRGKHMEMEQVLMFSNDSMISLCCFFHKMYIFI